MSGRRILVTGAGGFIGSHLCERLVREGNDVKALCRYTSEHNVGNLAQLAPDVRAELDVQFGDLLDEDVVKRFAEGKDIIFHLGASISVPYSYVAPRQVVMANVIGTLNVLTGARLAGTERLVHLSSSEVYGTAQYVPIDENHPLHAQSPYAASKVGADKLAETSYLSFGLPVVIARPFNTFGPRQSVRAVIPTIVMQALAGDLVRLGASSPTRDFVFVGDTIDALTRLGSTTDHAGETFNVSTGSDVSIERVVELVGEIVGRELHIVHETERIRPTTSEVYRLVGTSKKLSQALGWTPTTTLSEGLAAVVEWARTARHASPEYRI